MARSVASPASTFTIVSKEDPLTMPLVWLLTTEAMVSGFTAFITLGRDAIPRLFSHADCLLRCNSKIGRSVVTASSALWSGSLGVGQSFSSHPQPMIHSLAVFVPDALRTIACTSSMVDARRTSSEVELHRPNASRSIHASYVPASTLLPSRFIC